MGSGLMLFASLHAWGEGYAEGMQVSAEEAKWVSTDFCRESMRSV
ncbi:MAG: hypothetical protein LZF60_70027 [Nitrospira sp.]|nr:MAG: hypothetical protein LZF60_70027 [Nitrospira sp.]